MSGTLFEEIQKKKSTQRKEKIKFIFCLISSNIFVVFLTIAFNTSTQNLSKRRTQKIIHSNYKMINIPLEVLCDYKQDDAESPVTLVNKNRQLLIAKAYLHGPSETYSNRFKIEINEKDLLKLNADASDKMIAIPEIKNTLKSNSNHKQRNSNYEIII